MSRNAVAIVSSLLFVFLAALLVVIPVPYVAWRPGQTVDVLAASEEGAQVIEVSGLPTFDTTGQLLMTTVSTTRVDSTLSLPEAVFVFMANDSDAMPREVIYPPGKTSSQVQSEAVAMMDKSRINATVAALRAAGVAVSELPRVESVVLSGPSADRLQPGVAARLHDEVLLAGTARDGERTADAARPDGRLDLLELRVRGSAWIALKGANLLDVDLDRAFDAGIGMIRKRTRAGGGIADIQRRHHQSPSLVDRDAPWRSYRALRVVRVVREANAHATPAASRSPSTRMPCRLGMSSQASRCMTL